MKFSWFHVFSALLFCGAVSLKAQVEVSVRPDHTRLLQYEQVMASLKLENRAGEDLIFSGEDANARLVYQVARTPGSQLKPFRPELPVPGVVKTGDAWEEEINLLDYFPLGKTGPYSIGLGVEYAGEVFRARKAFIDVVPGLKLQKIRVKSSGGLMEFQLSSLHRELGNFLFVRIDEVASGKCRGVYELGRMLKAYEPVLKADAMGNVHILHQAAPGRFQHAVFNAAGSPVDHGVHESNYQAELVSDNNGGLEVSIPEPPVPIDLNLDVDSLKEIREGDK